VGYVAVEIKGRPDGFGEGVGVGGRGRGFFPHAGGAVGVGQGFERGVGGDQSVGGVSGRGLGDAAGLLPFASIWRSSSSLALHASFCRRSELISEGVRRSCSGQDAGFVGGEGAGRDPGLGSDDIGKGSWIFVRLSATFR